MLNKFHFQKKHSHQNSRSKNETLSTKKTKEETDYDKNTNLEINKYKIKEFYMLSITSEYYHWFDWSHALPNHEQLVPQCRQTLGSCIQGGGLRASKYSLIAWVSGGEWAESDGDGKGWYCGLQVGVRAGMRSPLLHWGYRDRWVSVGPCWHREVFEPFYFSFWRAGTVPCPDGNLRLTICCRAPAPETHMAGVGWTHPLEAKHQSSHKVARHRRHLLQWTKANSDLMPLLIILTSMFA